MRGVSLVYNNVQIGLSHVNSITSKPVLGGGVDYLYTEVVIDINGIINPQETAYINAGGIPVLTPGTLPPVTYTAISGLLKAPQGSLLFTNFLTNMFQTPNNGLLVDANNGPIPLDLKITEIDGGKTFHVNYVIKFFISECNTNDPYGLAYVSNRFGQAQSIDENFLTAIVTTGEAFFRTDLLSQLGVLADSFRNRLLPPVAYGYQRKRIDFKVNETANIIMYQCLDIETTVDLGNTGQSGTNTFITKFEGIYRQASISHAPEGLPNGVPAAGMQNAVMTVKLWGAKQANIWNMIQLAFGIMASSKLSFANKAAGFVRNLDFVQSLHSRYIEVTVMMQLNAQQAGPFGPFRTQGLQVPQVLPDFAGINPTPPNDNGTRGTSSLQLIASALTGACKAPVNPPCPPPGGSASQAAYCGPTPVVIVTSSTYIPPTPNKISPPTSNAPYTHAKISSNYQSHNGIMQAPVGANAQSYQQVTQPTCSIMTVFQPLSRRIVDWTAERAGSPPQIPSIQSSDSTQILLKHEMSALSVEVMPDNTEVYMISGRYEYAMKSAVTTLAQIPYDIPQWTNIPYGTPVIALQGNAQVHGLIDPGSGPTV